MQKLTLQQIALDFVDSRSASSFTKLYNRLKPGLRNFIMKYHKDSDVIDEILAITLSKAYVYVDKYDSQWNFSTWIYKICQNECLMEIRRHNTNISLDIMSETNTPLKAIRESDWKADTEYEFFDQNEDVEPDSIYSDILEEIKKLPSHYKDIISDRIIDKMKYKDIAEKRGMLINTVRSRIHSAKKVIKSQWIDNKIKSGSTNNIHIVGITVLEMLNNKQIEEEEVIDEESMQTLEFISAMYGSEETKVDITAAAREYFIKHGKLTASNKISGDPCKGVKKSLIIEYKIDDKITKTELTEGKPLKFRTKYKVL